MYLICTVFTPQVEAALQGLPTLGDLSVHRVSNTAPDVGYSWQVTFYTPVGDRDALGLDGAYLWNVNNDASISIAGGDNAIYPAGVSLVSQKICPVCMPGETPVGYRSADVSATTFTYPSESMPL